MKPTRILLARKHFFLCCAVAWTLLIAVLCLVSFTQLPSLGLKGTDKYVHIIFHLGFVTLWYLALTDNRKIIMKVAAGSFIYGILIEIAQELFTTTRHADIYDVMANSTGALMGVALIMVSEYYFKKNY